VKRVLIVLLVLVAGAGLVCSVLLARSLAIERQHVAAARQAEQNAVASAEEARAAEEAAEAREAAALKAAKRARKAASSAESAKAEAIETASQAVAEAEARVAEIQAQAQAQMEAAGAAVDQTFDYLAVQECLNAMEKLRYTYGNRVEAGEPYDQVWADFQADLNACNG
jgi:carboxypeptidase C (cathepsin A)